MITDPQVTEPKLSTVDDVRAWFDALHNAGVSFHPDDGFTDIVQRDTGEPTFATPVAVRMNVSMRSARAICNHAGVDVCGVSLESLHAYYEARGIPFG